MKSNVFGRLTILLFLYFFFSLSFIFSHGFHTFMGTVMMFVSVCFLIFLMMKPTFFKISVSRKKFIRLLQLGLWLNISLSWWLYGGLYQQAGWALQLSRLLLDILLPLSLILFFKGSMKYIKWVAILLLAIWMSLQLLMIISSPQPWIDVYEILKEAPQALLRGKNPYSITYKKMYPQVEPNFFSYLPFMFLYTAPFVVLFNDPRLGFILAQFLTFFILAKKFSWRDKNFGRQFSFLLGLLILFQPLSLYMTEQSYTEPLILLELVLFYYFLTQGQRWAGLILGIGLATKQYFVLSLLFLREKLNINSRWRKYLLPMIATTTAIIGPFFLINKKDFIYDTILIFGIFPPRYDGLSFFSTLFHLFKIQYSAFLAIAIWILSGIFLAKSAPEWRNNFIVKIAIFLLVFFYFNKWGYLNYYYLVANLLLVGIYTQVYEQENKIKFK